MPALVLRWRAGATLSCGARASHCGGFSCCGARALGWDLPGPGLEPMSPALAGGFLTTAPPGKPSSSDLNHQATPPNTHSRP